MDLIRPVIVAVVVWLVVSFLGGMLYGFATIASPGMSTATRTVWFVGTQLVVGLVVAAAAALAHGRPARMNARRHLIASAGLTVAVAIVMGVISLVQGTPALTDGMGFVVQVIGAVLGWLLVSRGFRHAERAEAARDAYY